MVEQIQNREGGNSVRAKLNSVIDIVNNLAVSVMSPEQFGALGDGVADDTTAVQAAFAWVESESGRKVVGLPGSVYRITSTITSSGHVDVDWNGASVLVDANVTGFKLDAGANDHALTADYVKGAKTLAVASTGTPLAPGSVIKIVSDAVDPGDRDEGSRDAQYRVAEWATVGIGSTATQIVLTQPLRFVQGINPTSAVGDEGRIDAYTTAMRATVMVPGSSRLRWRGGSFAFPDGMEATFKAKMLQVVWHVSPEIVDMTITRGYGAGIALQGTHGAKILRPNISNLENNTGNGQYGYGVADAAYGTRVEAGTFVRCRHGYTADAGTAPSGYTSADIRSYVGRCVGARIIGCLGIGFNETGAPFDTHMGAEDVEFAHCIADGCAHYGFNLRGRNIRATSPVIRNGGKGINCFTEYDSGDPDEDYFNAGKELNDFTSVQITNADIQCKELPFYFGTARAEIGGTLRVRCASHRMFSGIGVITVSATGKLVTTDMDGAVPLVSDNGTGVVDLRNPSTFSASAFPTSRLTFAAGSDIEIDASGAISTGVTGLSAESNGTIELRGDLAVALPASAVDYAGDVSFTSGGRYIVQRSGIVGSVYRDGPAHLGDFGTEDAAAFQAEATQAAIDAMEATHGYVRIASGMTASEDLSIRKALHFDPGAYLSANAGVTVTIQRNIESSRQHIFRGAGSYSLTYAADGYGEESKQVHASWFGAFPDVTINVDQAPLIQKAMDAMGNAREGVVDFDNGNYHLQSGIDVPRGIWVRGAGRRRTVFRLHADGFPAFRTIEQACRFSEIQFEPHKPVLPTRESELIRISHSTCEVFGVKMGESAQGIVIDGEACHVHDIDGTYGYSPGIGSALVKVVSGTQHRIKDLAIQTSGSYGPESVVLLDPTSTISNIAISGIQHLSPSIAVNALARNGDIKALSINGIANSSYTGSAQAAGLNFATTGTRSMTDVNVSDININSYPLAGVVLNQGSTGVMEGFNFSDVIVSGLSGKGFDFIETAGTLTNINVGPTVDVTKRPTPFAFTGDVTGIKISPQARPNTQAGVTYDLGNMADGTAQSINLRADIFSGTIVVTGGHLNYGLYAIRAAGSPGITPIVASANMASTTGPLAAGGGAAGRLNVSVDDDGMIYVSNRSGAQQRVQVSIMTGIS